MASSIGARRDGWLGIQTIHGRPERVTPQPKLPQQAIRSGSLLVHPPDHVIRQRVVEELQLGGKRLGFAGGGAQLDLPGGALEHGAGGGGVRGLGDAVYAVQLAILVDFYRSRKPLRFIPVALTELPSSTRIG